MSDNKDRETLATLGAGLFTNSVWDMLSVVVPLYGVAVGLNAAQIGLIVAARSVLPTALSIHGGIVMDQLGTRTVLLWLSFFSILLPVIYPICGWFSVLVALQLILGLVSSLGMTASQTWSLQSSLGDTATLARFSIATRIGTFLGPVIVGLAWDLYGAWVAFTCISVCGAGTLGCLAYCHPRGSASPIRFDKNPSLRQKPKALLKTLWPQWPAHKQALLLSLIPAVAFILASSFLRNSAAAIQSSLYIVYLESCGMNGTLIGTLVALAELAGVIGSLMAASIEKKIRAETLIIVCVGLSIITIAITPLIAPWLIVIIFACIIRGIAQGISQPLMYSVLSHEAQGKHQGASVGLRNAVVRLGSIITPAGMGFVAQIWGIEKSFYIMGGVFLFATALLALVYQQYQKRHPQSTTD
jgi:MFS family permease